ncbi:MAG TPA: purine-nucleoside phosphorylase [Polyangiaceae bacterium]|jgi:purine-nucleoside phosphorylase|nr:purine-nucleoside phosphorylase [Polyangiaceae bacterium]
MRADLDAAARFVTAQAPRTPVVGLVLGSGLGGFSTRLENRVAIPYASIPDFPATAVAGHRGELVLGDVNGVAVACLSGRVHLYEGHSPDRVVFGARLLATLGCRASIVTNAAGGIRDGLTPGALLLLCDHVNLTGKNPLVGPTEPGLPRFPDMTSAYDARFRSLAHDAALAEDLHLEEGVYAGLLGPSYETPAEVRMLRTLGADAVGMSTVLEVIALRHRGVRVGALSVITNLAAGLSAQLLDHAEVQSAADAARDRLERLLTGWIARIAVEVAHARA